MEIMNVLSCVSCLLIIILQLSSAQTPPADRCTHVIADSRFHVLEVRDTCYYLVQQRLTWEQSRDACRTRGMVIASIPNNETNRAIYQRAVDLDFNDLGNKSSYFIGARLQNRQNGAIGSIVWEDGNDSDFTNFDDFAPQRNGECVIIAASLRGRWTPRPCDSPGTFTGYICSSDTSSATKSVSGKIILTVMFTSVLMGIF